MSKKHDIINAAIKEFGENSYDAASVNRIIKTSGTSKGTFYHYFKNKKALYVTIIEEAIRIKKLYFSEMIKQTRSEQMDFFDILKLQAKAGAEFMRNNPELNKFGNRFAHEQNPVKDEICKEIIPEINVSFSGVIKAGISANCFSDRYPADFIEKIVGYVMMNYYDILFGQEEMPDIDEIEERLNMLFDFLKRGLN